MGTRHPLGLSWTLHGDGKTLRAGEVVAPDERLSWGRTIGIGAQHVVAMFGATFLVPIITGFPPATTLFFSGIGTMLFLLVTRGRVPSYLGSSFAFIAPLGAATAQHGHSGALGGVVIAGLTLFLVGAVVQFAGTRWISVVMPPVVTGAIVALIGLNLAPVAWQSTSHAPVTALVTVVAVCLITVLFRGILGRLSILLGVAIGYLTAVLRDEVTYDAVKTADWIGLPDFTAPSFHWSVAGLFIPVVLVLIAENIGHVKSVSAMTGEDLDPFMGRALMADGLATTLAGSGGGSGTTTYAENIGVMAATKVYSTAAYWVAGVIALLLSFSPKFGAAVATVPAGVIGGAGTVLYGMIGMLGVRIWVQNKVNFANPICLTTAAIALVVGIGDYTWFAGSAFPDVIATKDTDLMFNGIAMGSAAALLFYHLMVMINRVTRAVHEDFMEEPDIQERASELG